MFSVYDVYVYGFYYVSYIRRQPTCAGGAPGQQMDAGPGGNVATNTTASTAVET
jgi:hypothetical protein